MKTKKRSVDEIHPDPSNARKHSPRNIDAIAASLHRFGQQKPIVVDSSGVVRAGNGTLEAAKKLGWSEVAVVESDLEGAEMTAFAIADNRTAELAEWDDEVLAATLQALDDADVPLADAGFTAEELAEVQKAAGAEEAGEVVEDDVPEAPEEPITKPGDLWLLGRHRLLCGDSTDAANFERLMQGTRVDLLLTDPPYNIAYTGGSKKRDAIANDSMSDSDFRQFLVSVLQGGFDAMKPGAAFYIWHADSEGFNFRGAIQDVGQRIRQCLIWAKNNSMFGRSDYHWQHEPCLYGWKDGAAHGWYSDRKQTTLMHFDRPARSEDHPTMKPVEMIAYQIGNSTAPQGLVLDPFLGSGTTLIAAEQLGRACYGMELSPAYCDVIVRRWENLTGEKAELA
jgi:site-specific DNA-methyltransferase (adenine-specific)